MTKKLFSAKSKKELNTLFKERYNISYDKLLKLANELKLLGVKVKNIYDPVTHKMSIYSYRVYAQNWFIARCATNKQATSIVNAHKKHAIDYPKYSISFDDITYLTINEIIELINNLKSE